MAEDVWTTYLIGGEIKSPEALGKLLAICEEFGDDGAPEKSELMDAIVEKRAFVFEGLLANGGHPTLDAFLQEQTMPFSANWSACRDFDAGIRFWALGMAAPQRRLADDDGNPVIDLPALQAAQNEGRVLADVIAYLEAATRVAPLTAAPGAFDDVARRAIADRMGYPNFLKAVEVQSGEDRIEIALVPARRGYFVAVHVNCDPDNPTAGSSRREDFKDVILAAAAFDRAVREAKGEVVAEEDAG